MLGTAGIGIIGVLQSVIDIFRSTYSLGMDTAGVKEIAETGSKEDRFALDETISRFNIWFLTMACLALLTCVFLCYPLSNWAFGSDRYASHIAALSVCIFSAILTTGRSTILQGMRKIPELAKTTIWGSLFGLVTTIPVYLVWGIEGIIPAFIISSFVSFLSVEYYYRKQRITFVDLSVKKAFSSGLNTLKLGLYIVIAGIIGTVSMFLVRAFITRNIDVEATGLFQASWVITTVYLGLILRAMGSDYFPRLSAIVGDRKGVRTLVNEQTYIVLVVASPVIIGIIVFSAYILRILYSGEFMAAANILNWQILGSFLKIISWPVAFIMLARNKGLLFLITEIIFYTVYLFSAYLLYPKYGLDASGIGYFAAYVVYLPMVMWAGYKIADFYWDRNIIIMVIINAVLITAAFCLYIFSIPYAIIWSIIILCVSLVYSFYKLSKVFSFNDLKSWFRKR